MLDRIRKSIIYPGSQTQGVSIHLPKSHREYLVGPLEVEDRGSTIYLLSAPPLLCDLPVSTNNANEFHLIYCYGNGMCLSYSTFEFDYFVQLGLGVTIPEYLGYGKSSGNASEENCELTAKTTYRYLTEEKGISPDRIIVCGWSLGAAPAIYLAQHKPVGGLIVFSPFTSIHDVAPYIFPPAVQSLIPKSLFDLLIPEKFDNLTRITAVKCPIFIAHGTADEVIPVWMSKSLYDRSISADLDVTFYEIERANHNDIFEVGGNALKESIKNFINKLALLSPSESSDDLSNVNLLK
jgi:uncharacterized protein